MVKCGKCGEEKATAGEVRACGICRPDGTANEIPKDLDDDAPMEAALARKEGLHNRFTVIAAPAPAAPEKKSKRK